ncbi:hypothetical protein DTO166G4_9126 [Paecilomyces variotii]|uniref:Chromosome segregation protein BIR1 n=1 Tax=Byssochlamys spectabilis TaxID=264951 RepID=A0A443HK74_BYSSP|nr:hypothetical protein C8Q69DRAFT_104401 [Paecilomyces variotii]KAJ9209285.1 hypothetical protein DTO166G4_9126 [Paecilomyces variotii]KAJ9224210.1 hypothetical protein DTO169C6_3570 [Paecilomyces variotii]KAJ9227845.1 hypothetical protein DTO166G5_9111 [Paecilomyces variotii]KAJ9246275.1 hypothetical protein DTO207G8_9116 [Paecilomyces variotii]KAJ9283882.1 hypothetical protein DTO021C3_8566 [Paecilomyces variotii]
MSEGMETFAARLASFDITLKRRTSGAKGSKYITWPHSSPSPAELAHAGFYYKPYESNPDNTACFLCHRGLDGWEEDDNPLAEHLKHSPDCGWAVMMDIQQHSSNPSEIEDPTSDRIAEARKATFSLSWPHEGKRGWMCQTEKMVEAGWYFCPQEESDDLASCAYCKLSLDGWEPKDDPYEEHHRRSPDCSFFVFSQPPGKKTKGSKTRKPRASKTSRLSTQSTATAVSEAPTVDMDDAMDQSIMSQATTKSTRGKKSTKSKAKSSKIKKEEVDEIEGHQVDIDSNDGQRPEPPKPKRGRKGKKRTSDDISEDVQQQPHNEEAAEEPPTKKRATQSRESAAKARASTMSENERMDTDAEESVTEPGPKKRGRKPGRSSATRKVSGASAASKASLRSRIPDDAQIDAALEADLDGDGSLAGNTAVETINDSTISAPEKKSTASVAHIRTSRESLDQTADRQDDDDELNGPETHVVEAPVKSKSQKGRPKKKKATDSNSKGQDAHARVSHTDSHGLADPEEDSVISVGVQSRGHQESDAELETNPVSKKPSKKKAAPKGKKPAKAQKLVVADTESVPDDVSRSDDELGQDAPRMSIGKETAKVHAQRDSNSSRRSSQVPPKTAERYSDIPREQHHAEALANSQHRKSNSRRTSSRSDAEAHVAPSSLPAPTQKSTPSPSPQSSDAENRPPSSRPSAVRPPVISPTKTVRIPLGETTPAVSPSKRNTNIGRLRTSHPWKPVDVDEIVITRSNDKENIDVNGLFGDVKGELSTSEKKMTVEEWILWNAKNGEERLKYECERLVGLFEKEGGKAMRTLEGIECVD